MTNNLMLHLVANYPNPPEFTNSLGTILSFNPEFLEVQLPFSNPMADGTVIYEANQVGRYFEHTLEQILQTSRRIQLETNSTTNLILMSYFTPLSIIEPQDLVDILVKNNFKGAIIPDLTFGTPEQIELSRLFHANGLYLIPVIANNSKSQRLQFIRSQLSDNQPIYVMSHFGKTGSKTILESSFWEYLHDLKTIFDTQQICVGFGISTPEQVRQLQSKNYTPVIGSAIVRSITGGTLEQYLGSIQN